MPAALFTAENRGAVLQGVRAGLTITEAAERAGLSSQLVRNWLSQGRGEADTEHARFAAAVDEAREDAASADLTEDEFRRHLNKAVRSGSIQAARLWWSVNRPDRGDDRDRLPDALDELRAQRQARLAALRASGANGNGHG